MSEWLSFKDLHVGSKYYDINGWLFTLVEKRDNQGVGYFGKSLGMWPVSDGDGEFRKAPDDATYPSDYEDKPSERELLRRIAEYSGDDPGMGVTTVGKPSKDKP